MKNNIINIALKKDVKNFIENIDKVVNISKGTISGFSIEIEEANPQTFNSYTYHENEKLRDTDFDELELLIKNNK